MENKYLCKYAYLYLQRIYPEVLIRTNINEKKNIFQRESNKIHIFVKKKSDIRLYLGPEDIKELSRLVDIESFDFVESYYAYPDFIFPLTDISEFIFKTCPSSHFSGKAIRSVSREMGGLNMLGLDIICHEISKKLIGNSAEYILFDDPDRCNPELEAVLRYISTISVAVDNMGDAVAQCQKYLDKYPIFVEHLEFSKKIHSWLTEHFSETVFLERLLFGTQSYGSKSLY